MQPSLHRTVLQIAMIAWLAAACTSTSPGLTAEQLKKATYAFPDAPGGSITLVDGQGQAPIATGSASLFKAILLSPVAFGDLDSSGEEDAASIVVVDPGGSGSFSYLAVLVNRDGEPAHAGSALLGDRIKIKTVSIADGKITVTYLDRKPGEPFSAEPSQEVTRTFQLANGELLEAP